MEDETILLSKLLRPDIKKYIEIFFELVDHYKSYNYRLLNKLDIVVSSDFFILKSQLGDFPKEVLDILEKLGVIKYNRVFPDIIEVVNPNIIIDIYSKLSFNLNKNRKTTNAKENKELPKEYLLDFYSKFVEPRIKDVQGLDIVKKIMLLQIFSERDGAIRNRIHILLFGDPGTGKTLLLQWQAKVSNGVYRSLRITYAGLGGSVRLSDFQQHEPLLKKANGKILCIDEIDKMNKEDLDPLLNAMEEGIVTLSGATMDIIYEAKVRVFAAANRDVLRPELKDRFDYIKYLRRLRLHEISQVITHLIDFMSDKDVYKLYIEGIEIIRKLYESAKDYHPRIKDPERVSKAILDILSEDETADSVRHSQKWLRFAFAYAKMKKSPVTVDLIHELYDQIKE